MSSTNYDVTIIGGGLAGLTIALQLKRANQDISVLVIEKCDFPAPEAAHKVGESSVEIGAHYFAQILGQKKHIEEQQLPKFGLRYFFSDGVNTDITKRFEIGGNQYLPTPSYQFDRGRFENHLAQEVKDCGVHLISGRSVSTLSVGSKKHTVTLRESGEKFESRWLIDSSGHRGLLRQYLDLNKAVDHNINSAWFRLNCVLNINDWSDSPAWLMNNQGDFSRRLSTNHLIGSGYWVWIIPLSSGQTSIGIVADESLHPLSTYNSIDKALSWLTAHEPQCAEVIHSRREFLSDFLARKHFCHSADQVFSTDQWYLTGDAGVFLDPFYSPGSDFIAVSNTFISDLITRAFTDEDVRKRTRIYHQLYYSFFENTLLVYQHQYPLFGHTTVMPIKIVWDWAIYWSHLSFIFLQGYLCDVDVFAKIKTNMFEVAAINSRMQKMFRTVSSTIDPHGSAKTVDLTCFDYLYELNRSLTDQLDPVGFVQAYNKKFDMLQILEENILKSLLGSQPSSTRLTRFFDDLHAM